MLSIPQVRLGEVLRARYAAVVPGGKGVNAARALACLGASAQLVGFCPGRTGKAAADMLADEGIKLHGVPTGGELRSAAHLVEDSGRVTVVNEPGPPVSSDEWSMLTGAVAARLRAGSMLICIGSLPPGAPADGYAGLIEPARARGVAVLVDAAGAILDASLKAEPDFVVPNLEEAEDVLGASSGDVRARAETASSALVGRGARTAIVTAGADGAAVATAFGTEWLPALRVDARNPIGAGDAFVAGLALALSRHEPISAAVRHGMAAAMASVETMLPGKLDPARAAQLEALIPRI